MMTDRLREMIERHGTGGTGTALPKLALHHATRPRDTIRQCPKPTLCVVLQGRKCAYVGEAHVPYDPGHFIVSLIEMPLASAVVAASPAQPYLGLALELDLIAMAALAMEMRVRPASSKRCRGLIRAPFETDLADALTRYLGLLDRSEDIPFLASGMEREIWYRLLCGQVGSELSQLAFENSMLARIAQSSALLRERYAEPASIADLAAASGMSRTKFHDAFRQATGTSPLQYQKTVRMQEARRLLRTGRRKAEQVAFEVGYASPSHFNRDYRKAFGLTPIADMNPAS